MCCKDATLADSNAGAPVARRGFFFWEVTGDDHAARNVRRDASNIPSQNTNANPLINQSEFGSPQASINGIVLRRNQTRVVRQMNPLYYGHRFLGFVGGMINPNRAPVPLPYYAGYDGIAPLVLQPKVNKPLPFGG